MTTRIKLKKSSVTSNAPSTGDLDYGELAINYADGKLYYKNSSNVIKNFSDSDTVAAQIAAAVAEAGGYNDASVDTHLNTATANSGEVLSWTGSDYDWVVQSGGLDSAAVVSLVDSAYVQLRQDYAYSSLTGAPSIPQSGVDFDPVGTDNSTDVTLAGSYDYLTLSGQEITLNQVDYSTDISNLPNILDSADVAAVAGEAGYTTCLGTVTSVSAGTGLTGGPITTTGSLSLATAGAGAANYTGGISAVNVDAYGRVTSVSGSAGYTTCVGTVTSVTVSAGTGLSGGGTVTTSGTATLNLDFSELTDMTGDITGTTEFILQDGTTESRKAANEIKLSNFVNDAGWTSYDSADTIGLVDSAYVQARQDYAYTSLTGAPNVLDSADVIAIHNAQGGGVSSLNDLSDVVADSATGSSLSLGIGFNSLLNDDGLINFNTAVGYNTLCLNTTGIQNTVVGYGAAQCGNISCSIAVGHRALHGANGSGNIAIGHCAIYNTVLNTGNDNIGVGSNALKCNTTGSSNVAIGTNALLANTTGYGNTAIGSPAGCKITSGKWNTSIGRWAHENVTTGSCNTALGYQAGAGISTNSNNVHIGYLSGYLGTGSCNIGIGVRSVYTGSGVKNIGIGECALRTVSTSNNLAIGWHAYKSITGSAAYGVAIGNESLAANTTGARNTAIGFRALYSNTGGSNNTTLGQAAGCTITTGNNNLVLGYGAQASSATVSNEITLGDASITSLRIPGLQSGATTGDVLTYDGSKLVLQAASASGLDSAAVISLVDSDYVRLRQVGALIDSAVPTAVKVGDFWYDKTDGTLNIYYQDSSETPVFVNVAASTAASTAGLDSAAAIALMSIDNLSDGSTAGTRNVALGTNAGTGQAGNTTVGFEAGCNLSASNGDQNVFLGTYAGKAFSVADHQVGIGYGAMCAGTSVPFYNVAVGSWSMKGITGGCNTALGAYSMCSSLGATCNTAVGYSALRNNTTGNNNVAIGAGASYSNTTGTDNVAIGFCALYTGTNNLNKYNTAIGSCSMRLNVTGCNNVAVGTRSLEANTIGTSNVAVGVYSLLSNTTGSNNTAVGLSALESNTTGYGNTAVGTNALKCSTTGAYNVAIGQGAADALTCAQSNVAIGYIAMTTATTGGCNVAIGKGAAQNMTIGGDNVVIGANTNVFGTTGCKSVIVGSNAAGVGLNCSNGCNNIIIGYNAQPSSATVSNEITLGDANITSFRIPGLQATATHGQVLAFDSAGGNIAFTTAAASGLDSAQVSTIVTSYGYTTCTGTVTSVSAGTGLTGGPITTSGSLSLATAGAGAASYTGGISAVDVDAYGRVTSVTGSAGYTTCTGTVTSVGVTAGTGLSGGGTVTTSGSVTLDLDFSELTDMTGDISGTTEFILQDGTTESRKAASEIKLSNFNNDVGWTTYDSNATITLVDSAYVQLRAIGLDYNVLSNKPAGGLDSAAVLSLTKLVYPDTSSLGLGTGALVNDDASLNSNTAVGICALNSTTAGAANVAFGGDALKCNTTGNINAAFGTFSLQLNTTGSCNTAIGGYNLCQNTIGSNNIAVGFQSLAANTTGTDNVAVGLRALCNNTVGFRNVGIGYLALTSNTSGIQNAAVGSFSLYSNTTGRFNASLGHASLCANTTGQNNSAVGYQALEKNTVGQNNTAIGTLSLNANTTGGSNTAVGVQTLRCNTGSGNVGLGAYALCLNTADNNTAIGTYGLRSNTTGVFNTAVGYDTLRFNTIGTRNTAVGTASLYLNTSANYNTAVGYASLYTNNTGMCNTAVGSCALVSNTSGKDNSVLGFQALRQNTTGNYNTAIGSGAMYSNTYSICNTAVGYTALCSNTIGSNNTAVGTAALLSNSSGTGNVAVGTLSLFSTTFGATNTAIGYRAGCTLTIGSNVTAIGNNAQPSSATASNEITLGDTNITSLRIPGLQSGATTGDVLTYDGSKLVLSAPTGGGGGGVSAWVTKTANYTASNGDRIVADTTGGTFTITLPATPSAGDQVTIADGGDFSATNLTVGRNGSTIEGAAEDVTIDIKNVLIDFVYDSDATWQIYTQGILGQYGLSEDSSSIMYPTMVYHDSDTSGLKITSDKFSFDASSGTLSVTDLNSTSDATLKENISVIDNAVEKVKNISGVSFNWKDNKRAAVGVLAQEVEKILPELVDINTRGEKSVKYNGIVGLLVEAIKEQQQTIDNLKQIIDRIK